MNAQETLSPLAEEAEEHWSPSKSPTNTQPLEKGNALYAQIARTPFFRGMKPNHLRLLADSAMHSTFDPGQLIFQRCDPANRFYVILHGNIQLESVDRNGVVHRIEKLGPGDVLGWSWLFPPYYWHFDAVVQEQTEVLFFYGTRLRQECDKDHDFGYALMSRMSQVAISRLQATRLRMAGG